MSNEVFRDRYLGHVDPVAFENEIEYRFRDLHSDLVVDPRSLLACPQDAFAPSAAETLLRPGEDQEAILRAAKELAARGGRKIPISDFIRMRKANDMDRAMKLLHEPIVVDPTGSVYESNDDPEIDFDEPTHNLDAFSIVCRTRGFGGILPARSASINFETTLLPPQAMKPMRDHYAHFGFDITERAFYFGTSHNRDMWLLFRPNGERCDARGRLGRGGMSGRNTPLTTDCRHAFQLYLARCLRKAGVVAGFTVRNHEFSDAVSWQLEACTNLLSTPRLPLDLATMRALNRNLCHYYDDWAGSLPSNTPRAAAIKNFFTKSEPIGMSNNYGQNRPAFQETPEDVENLTQEFNESHTFSEIRFISCAIATTFRVRHRSSIIEERFFPVRELGGKIYAKHLQSGEMRRVRDENLDRFDEFPKTPLYRQYLEPAGKKRYARIQRSEREYGGRHKGALGVMLNLAKCRRSYEDVFVPVADDDERRDPEARDGARGHAGGEPRFPSEDPANGMNPGQGFGDAGQGPRASRVRTHDEFPVGFMRNIGNIQTNSPLPYLKPILQAINDEVRHEELRDCCWNPHSQIYGEYWHLQNDVTKDNPLAKGELTAIFAGAHFPSTSPNGQKCRRLIEAVRARGPPYSVYESKLDVAGDHIGLRMEPTIHIDLDCLAPECQTGAYIYTDILMQACGAWATPINCARIIDGMVIFKPDVFPACILATTFPLQATMDAMYTAPRTVVALSRQDERQGAPPKVRIPVTQIELMADLERLMSWAGSGDNRVLPNLHLRQLFVFDGLDHFTWPMFAKSLELHLDDDGSPDLRMDVFPQTPNLTTLSSASAAILYRYGFMAAEAFRAESSVALILSKTSSDNTVDRTIRLSAKLIVDTLIKELRGTVFDQVTSKLKAAERDQAHEPFLLERTQGRLDSLKNWMKESNPFDYSAAPKQFVGNNEDEPDTPLPLSSPNHLPISLLVSMTLSIARLDDNSSRHVCAQHLMASCPGFARVASVVYQKLSESWPATAGTDWSTEIADRKFSAAFEKELDQAAVRVIPWFAVADWERPGAGKHRIGPHAWVMVDPPRKNRQAIRDLPAVHRDIIDAETVTATLRLNNPAAPWKLSDCQTLAQLLFFLTSRSVLPNELLPASLLQPKSWTAGAKAAYATLDILVPAHQYVIWVAVITARSCPKLTVLEVRTDEADQALFANATKRLGSGIALGEWLQSLPFKISSREKQTKGRTEMNSTMQGIIMYYLTSVVTTSELVAAGATADWNKSNKWTDKFGSKGIKPLLLFRIGLVSSSALTSLPWSPKSSTWDFLSFAELEAKLMVAKTTIASDGFQAIVAQIWGQPFYNALVSTGRLQLT